MKVILGVLFALIAGCAALATLFTLSVWAPGQGELLLGYMTGIGRLINLAAIVVTIVFGGLAYTCFARG